MAHRLSILLLDGRHERAHYALVLATGAAAIGRDVTLFASNGGLHALTRDWHGLEGWEADRVLVERGVAGFEALREAAISLGVGLLACEAGLAAMGIDPGALLAEVRRAGVATFLADSTGQFLTV